MQVPPLTDAGQKELLSQPLVAELATVSPSGSVRITPIWFKAQDDGSILMNTWDNTVAVKNIKKNPKCALMIDQAQEFPYHGIHFEGTATIEGPENDHEGIATMFTPYRDNDAAVAKEYANLLIGWGTRVYIRFKPEKTTSWDFRQG